MAKIHEAIGRKVLATKEGAVLIVRNIKVDLPLQPITHQELFEFILTSVKADLTIYGEGITIISGTINKSVNVVGYYNYVPGDENFADKIEVHLEEVSVDNPLIFYGVKYVGLFKGFDYCLYRVNFDSKNDRIVKRITKHPTSYFSSYHFEADNDNPLQGVWSTAGMRTATSAEINGLYMGKQQNEFNTTNAAEACKKLWHSAEPIFASKHIHGLLGDNWVAGKMGFDFLVSEFKQTLLLLKD